MPNTVCQWSAGLPKAKRKATGFERPTWNWDKASQDKVRDALLALNETLPDLRRAAGRRDEVDPIRHLIVTGPASRSNTDWE